MNIILIGFASSGKTTTAKAICEMTGQRGVDLDRVIEERFDRRYGRRMSCREIFIDRGSDGFSELENEALRSLSNMRNSVLSTGGRTPIHEDNRPLLKSLGKIVYIKCGLNAVLDRMKSKGYPASMGGTAEGVAEEWGKRAPIYSEIADIVIDNDTMTPEETAKTIINKTGIS